MHSQKYTEHLRSEYWQRVRQAVYDRQGGICAYCHRHLLGQFDCHHRTYAALGRELEALEGKIEQVVALVHQLRAENEVLKNQMAAAEAERLHLRQTMTVARERLEGLMDKLPEDA